VSAAEPSSAPPPRRKREIVLRLEGGAAKGWRRKLGGGGAQEDQIQLSGSEITFEHSGLLQRPLAIPAGLVAVAAVDQGSERARTKNSGRFAILHRVGPTEVIPAEQGVEGWLWTSESGSALPTLGTAAPNLALVFVKPLDDELVKECFRPAALAALAERSPLGAPAVSGLLACATDPAAAEQAFAELGVVHPLTDREVAPAQRRRLPADRPARSVDRDDSGARERTSVPPPGR
jgi:hypothetical protein